MVKVFVKNFQRQHSLNWLSGTLNMDGIFVSRVVAAVFGQSLGIFPKMDVFCLVVAFSLLQFVMGDLADIGDFLINIVNKHPRKHWRAKRNKFSNDTAAFRTLLGTKILDDVEFEFLSNLTEPASTVRAVSGPIPAQFDARTNWPTCSSIREIRDQGGCGSCWAHSVASALSDRICIKSVRKQTYAHISAQDFMTCCAKCGSCNGGIVEYAYDYFNQVGAVTGGEYGQSSTGCKPYTIPPKWPDVTKTPACTKTCSSGYWKTYAQDTYQGTSWTVVSKPGITVSANEQLIQREIMDNGPVSCSMQVYQDFASYESGVYSHLTGSVMGGHAVKCMGWGVDATTGVPYWLVANSWGTDWGEKGFFRIRRGNNECNIEARVNAGTPKQY